MNTEELFDRLTDAEGLIALQAKRLKAMEENQERISGIEVPDYTSSFEEVKQLIQELTQAVPKIQMAEQINSFKETVAALPKALPVEHHHHFEDSAKRFLLGGILLLVLTALTTGISFSLYHENSKLEAHDVKYRMIRLFHPEVTLWADSVYQHEPDHALQLVERLEAKQLSIARAEELARRKEAEAREAARQVEKLRDKR